MMYKAQHNTFWIGWRRNAPVGSARLAFGLVLWGTLALPRVRAALEATMTRHMLVELTLLVLAGMCLAVGVPLAVRRRLARWNARGITGLILASVVSTFWMLPIALDAALDVPAAAAFKFLGVPLLIGLPLALSWPRAGFIVRAVFLAEFIATLFRAGWLYLISPERLCSNYLLGDQQWLGGLLLAVGAGVLLCLAGLLLFGNFRTMRDRDGGPTAPAKPGALPEPHGSA